VAPQVIGVVSPPRAHARGKARPAQAALVFFFDAQGGTAGTATWKVAEEAHVQQERARVGRVMTLSESTFLTHSSLCGHLQSTTRQPHLLYLYS